MIEYEHLQQMNISFYEKKKDWQKTFGEPNYRNVLDFISSIQ